MGTQEAGLVMLKFGSFCASVVDLPEAERREKVSGFMGALPVEELGLITAMLTGKVTLVLTKDGA